MRQVLAVGALAAVLAAVLAVSGCVPKDVIPTLPPTPTATPVFATEEEALAAAEEAYAAYLEMSDLIASEGGVDPERLSEVATGELVDETIRSLTEFRQNNWVLVGTTELRDSSPQFVDTSASVGTSEAIGMYFCVDVSDVDVRDIEGNSVVSDGRPDLQAVEVVFDLDESGHPLPSTSTAWEPEAICGS